MDSNPEEWVPAVGFEGYYEVSNLGRVRSLDRLAKNSRGNRFRKWKGRLLQLNLSNRKKYINCKLSVGGKTYTRQLHWLVLASFRFKPSAEKCHINHIDGDKRNNRLDNLEWVTPKENVDHAVKTGLHKAAKGSNNGQSKLSEKLAVNIKKDILKGSLNVEIAKKYSVSLKIVSDIKTGRTWKHLEEK